MKNIATLTTVLILIISPNSGKAQQDPLYNQYLFNQLMINPAYAGIHNTFSANLNTRSQWAGLDGAPLTNTLSVHSSLLSNSFGAGLLLINDRLGINNNYEAQFIYSYKIDFDAHVLSFGLQGGIASFNYDYSSLNLEFVDDPNFLPVDEGFSKPNFGTGIFFKSDNYYLGVSIPRILNVDIDDGVTSSTRYNKHFYVSGGYLLNLSELIKLKPIFLLRIVQDAPISADIGGSVLLKEFLWAGLTLRNLNTVSVNAQIQLSEVLRFGYSFELPTSSLIVSNFGTHELMLALDLALFNYQINQRRYF